MTTTATLTGSPRRSLPGARSRAGTGVRDRALTVFVTATGVGLLHAVDDALLHRQPGVPVDQHLWGLLAVTVGAALAVAVFRRGRTGVRAVLALAVGALTSVNGALHVLHALAGQLSGSDLTGILAAVAGAVLLVMSVVLPFRHRGERGLGPARRWSVRLGVTGAVAVLVVLGLLPVSVGIVQTHLFRDTIGAAPAGFREVAFDSSDGLALSGWYAPSGNGAAVVLVNSAGGDRLGSVRHARLLARHGYGVLLYDARGSGNSEGSPNGYGWDWDRDVSGALDFLTARPDVDPRRIGALGLSTGADVLLEVAAQDRRVRAVVADGATASSMADIPASIAETIRMAPVMASVRLFSGTRPGRPLRELAAQVSPTPLLFVATGGLPVEIPMSRIYADAAREPVELWVLPGAGHTTAIRDEAAAYERRVVGHFDDALLDGGSVR